MPNWDFPLSGTYEETLLGKSVMQERKYWRRFSWGVMFAVKAFIEAVNTHDATALVYHHNLVPKQDKYHRYLFQCNERRLLSPATCSQSGFVATFEGAA